MDKEQPEQHREAIKADSPLPLHSFDNPDSFSCKFEQLKGY